MRIWHEQLIPKLCQKHICGVWRESLGVYAIVTGAVDGGSYRNHPATQEFINAPYALWQRLSQVREEMLRRGYHPKPLPEFTGDKNGTIKEWQTLEEQIAVLRAKGCKCNL